MTNPLIDKFYELHPEKKQKPKVINSETAKVEFELNDEFLEKLTLKLPPIPVISNIPTPSVATSSTGITKASTLTSYNNNSANDVFLQIAEKVRNGSAQVSSVSMSIDATGVFSYGKRISFEVYDYEP